MLRLSSRWILLVGLVLALIVPVQAQEDEEVYIAPLPCESPGKLTMWIWSANWQPNIQKAIDMWEAEYCPGAEVDLQLHEPFGAYWGELAVAAELGVLPDVFTINQVFFYDYASQDRLLNLQPYWDAAEVDTMRWGPGLVDPYRWGEAGDLYAGPVNWDTVAVFYNKDLFDAAGVPYPTDDWDWNLFASYAEALTDPESGVYGALAYVSFQAGYPNWIASTGTMPLIDVDRTRCTLGDEGSMEALAFLRGLVDAGSMPMLSEVSETLEVETITNTESYLYWADRKAAMVTAGSWVLPDTFAEIDFNWGVAPLPKHPATGRSRSIVHAVGYAGSAASDQADLAANLILYLVSDEAQALFAEAGGVAPANPSPALQREWVETFGETNVDINVFVSALIDSQGISILGEMWNLADVEIAQAIFDTDDVDLETTVQEKCESVEAMLPD